MKHKALEKEYRALCIAFGVNSGSRCSLYNESGLYTYYDASKKSLIGEYLVWEDFTERARAVGFVYYSGIDDFLREYRRTVYKSLNL